MDIVKIKGSKYDKSKLTYKAYLSILPQGNTAHYEALTGNKPEPIHKKAVEKVLKEEKPVQKPTKKEDKSVKVTKEEKEDLETK